MGVSPRKVMPMSKLHAKIVGVGKYLPEKVLSNTDLEKMFNKENFHILTREEYIDIVINQLEELNENIVINRITGDPVKEDLIAPEWLLKKFVVLNEIDKEMVRRDTYQGRKLK